jgi:hypothetical protein
MAKNMQMESSMSSFELETDEKSRVGSMFMARVANEIRRVAALEKASRKITQQAVAEKIGTSRAVVNREIQGLENLSARRIAELLWALGWEPHFEARKVPDGHNEFVPAKSNVAEAGRAMPRSEFGRSISDLISNPVGLPSPGSVQ